MLKVWSNGKEGRRWERTSKARQDAVMVAVQEAVSCRLVDMLCRLMLFSVADLVPAFEYPRKVLFGVWALPNGTKKDVVWS